ncbi:hypothetical protein PV05_10809 [Exophiala xenobiotica]|uniref:Helicase ATP-binding domain-containing protein n=1 Tax=Exophiala xenobiotica TaxID=348802 RepID=A0A0D2E103_9EURO|nr:uncharacterized protein PV05_10809 [Exophiala xenobiotica]KIW49098.1 hypothetical protein PV05_10809 [Exophiala xenobiotica]
MVREQVPPRNPLSPSMGNTAPPAKPQEKGKQPDTTRPQQLYPNLQNSTLEQPQFGKPTALGASPQPYSRTQPLVRPTANVSAPRQATGSQPDKYSNLFVASKKPSQRPELHKPHGVANPLQAFRDFDNGSSQSSASRPRPSDDELFEIPKPANLPQQNNTASYQARFSVDDVYEIPKPANLATWQPKPVAPPTFSSQQSANPYFIPQNVVDRIGFATNSTLWHEEQYAAADPSTYMDWGKANENIKALLEGAFEDEEDKPRTRRRKKQLETKLDELSDKLKGMSVATDEADKETGDDEDEEEEDDGTIPGLKVKLLPHQIEGVSWMCDKETGIKKTRGVLPKGGILADDMGLGKTIQSIALVLTNPKPSPEELEKTKRKLPEGIGKGTLVVAPLALIKQWEGEMKDRVEKDHALNICVHHGPGRTKNYRDLRKYDVVITTYQTLSSEHAGSEGSLKVGCFGVHWYRIILDEAHSIKNRNAKATKAACALNAEYRWCLTGTPMQNNLDELQSLIHFLRIKPYDDLNQWRESITKPMNSGRGGLALRRLQVYLKAFMKRRTKDILKQQGPSKDDKSGTATKGPGFKIVERTVEKVEAEFTEQERKFYERLESRTDRSLEMMMAGNKMSYASALVLLMRLRQACNHPKLTGSDLSTENDGASGSQTPSRRKASVEDDMDSIANMLGGLSVESKRCDVCQMELTKQEAHDGAIRCAECEADLEEQNVQLEQNSKAKKEKRVKKERQAIRKQRKEARRVIRDIDDEDDPVTPAHEEDEEDEASSLDNDEEESTSDEGIEAPGIMQSTKIRRLLGLLKADAHQHKYIVFSFFTSMLDLIEPFLRENRIRFVRYDGKMRNDAREASLHSLRTDPSTRVLLCSLRAGSLGLNLTAASRVVILEPFWNPFVEEQAIDRVHRLNQTVDVKVFKLTVKGTVEERILALQEKKRELANAAIEGRKGAMKLTLQDMLKLFGRDAEREEPVEVQNIGSGPGLLDSSGSRPGGSASVPQGASTSQGMAMMGSNARYGAGSGTGSGSGRDRDRERVRERERMSDGTKKVHKDHEIYGRRW